MQSLKWNPRRNKLREQCKIMKLKVSRFTTIIRRTTKKGRGIGIYINNSINKLVSQVTIDSEFENYLSHQHQDNQPNLDASRVSLSQSYTTHKVSNKQPWVRCDPGKSMKKIRNMIYMLNVTSYQYSNLIYVIMQHRS